VEDDQAEWTRRNPGAVPTGRDRETTTDSYSGAYPDVAPGDWYRELLAASLARLAKLRARDL
jgi:hypothetical protein